MIEDKIQVFVWCKDKLYAQYEASEVWVQQIKWVSYKVLVLLVPNSIFVFPLEQCFLLEMQYRDNKKKREFAIKRTVNVIDILLMCRTQTVESPR